MMKKILFVSAHPDDESFTSGGTIAKYASQGWQVDVICLTKGQAGQRGIYENTVDLGAIRSSELEAAASVLGIASVKILEYVDGKLGDINPGELEDILYKLLLVYEPDVIMTFEPNGISNHPDHKKISISTTFAFQKYATRQAHGEKLGTRDPRKKFVKSLPPSTKAEPKLYYACMPESVAAFLREQHVIPDESFGRPWRGVDDKKVTTCIDISDFTEKKLEALSKHKTQLADVERFISIDAQPLMYKEYYILRMQGEQEIFMGKTDSVLSDL